MNSQCNSLAVSRVPLHEMKIAAMVVLAALSGWFVRGIRFGDAVEPLPARPAMEQTAPIEEPAPVIHRIAVDVASLGNRNLFAYRIHEPPAITHRAFVHPEPVVSIAPSAEIVPAAVPEPPPRQSDESQG